MCWSILRDPQVLRTLAMQDFDVILLDCQHGFHDENSVLEGIQQVAAVGKSAIVRIPVGRWDFASRVLDHGALGVVAPMINTADDARAFANACKYPETGQRSFGPAYAASLYGVEVPEYIEKANAHTFALAQVETREAYDNLDEILSVDGMDGTLMGPGDFSISMTGNIVPDSYGSETVGAIADIAARTRAAGKLAAAFTDNAEHAALVREMGYSLVSIMIDQAILQLGSTAALDAVAAD